MDQKNRDIVTKIINDLKVIEHRIFTAVEKDNYSVISLELDIDSRGTLIKILESKISEIRFCPETTKIFKRMLNNNKLIEQILIKKKNNIKKEIIKNKKVFQLQKSYGVRNEK